MGGDRELATRPDTAPAAQQAPALSAVPAAPVPLAVQGLVVGHAEDRAEIDADKMADAALSRLRRLEVGGASDDTPPPDTHQHGAGCDHLRRSSEPSGSAVVGYEGGVLDIGTSSAIASRLGSGRPLDADVRRRMEGAFGASLSSVRIHADDTAAELNDAVSAQAFTAGKDVFFGKGQYAPHTPAGERVLAHELAHTLQPRTDAPLQRRVYKALSDSQQAQVDAVAENVYDVKARTFEGRVGTVAAAHPLGNAAANNMLQQLAVQRPAQAWVFLGQLGQPVNAKAQYLATTYNATLPGAAVAGSRSAQVMQTYDLAPGLEPNQTHVTDPYGLVAPAPKQLVNQQTVDTLDANGRVKVDSAYAQQARTQHMVVRGAGAVPASKLFAAATATGTDLGHTKVLALGWLLGGGTHSFHEVMLAASDAGLPYNPGPRGRGYRDLAPLTQSDIGLHLPEFFFQPDFLILLARALFPDDANDRTGALALMPADVQMQLLPIVQRFRGVRSDVELTPLLNVGLARTLVEKLSAVVVTQLSAFVAFDLIGALNWTQVQAHGTYGAVAAEVGASETELIFGHLFDRRHPGTGARWLARGQNVLGDAPSPSPVGDIGFNQAQHLRVEQSARAAFDNYGAHDRGVPLQATGPALAALTSNEKSSINEYTSNNFGTWHSLAGGGAQTPMTALTAMLDDGARDNATQQMLAARGGLHRLPVYPGPVYRGTGGAAAATQGLVNNLVQGFSPGQVYAPHIFLSGAKTIADSFIRPTDIAMVIEEVKTGHDIQLLSNMPREREVLFEPNARFVVTRVENRLTPVNPNPFDANHVFTGGNLYIYLREISSQKSVVETNARDTAFNQAEQRNTDGRRLVDNALYGEAYAAYMTEQRPLARPENRFEHDGALTALPANVPLADTTFTDWKTADTYMRTCVGRPLTLPEIGQIHAHASARLANAHPGMLRGAGVDVGAGGRIGPNNEWMSVDNNELAALQGNPSLTVDGVDAFPVPPLELGIKTHTCRVRYVPGANVAAALGGWHATYVTEFQRLLGRPADQARNVAAANLAADAQRAFISLHPFRDGNGRSSRLLLDHILLSFGVPETIVADPNLDIMVSDMQWRQEVANGVLQLLAWQRYYRG